MSTIGSFDVVLGAVVLHCPLARRISTEIVHDAVPARRQPGVEVLQGLDRGLVQVPVEPYYGPGVPRQRR